MIVELVLAALLALAILMVARGRAAETAASAGAPLLFTALAAVAVTAVWLPVPYEALADAGLRAAGLHERLRALDAAVPVDALAQGSADLLDRVTDLFGRVTGQRPESLPEDGAPPAETAAPGLVERSLYPGLVAIVALVVRAGALAVALAGMVATVALGWAARAVRAGRAVRAQAADLEARVAALERRAGADRSASGPGAT